jgi:hypothetical protein
MYSRFIIGYSCAGIREAPLYVLPSIYVGIRQHKRGSADSIINVDFSLEDILNAIQICGTIKYTKSFEFGDGLSSEKFFNLIVSNDIWSIPRQKYFIDL